MSQVTRMVLATWALKSICILICHLRKNYRYTNYNCQQARYIPSGVHIISESSVGPGWRPRRLTCAQTSAYVPLALRAEQLEILALRRRTGIQQVAFGADHSQQSVLGIAPERSSHPDILNLLLK